MIDYTLVIFGSIIKKIGKIGKTYPMITNHQI